MSKLFTNALVSIQLGVEDYKADDAHRAISATRNFYAGVLLLAKETLLRRAPKADIDKLLATRYKPVLLEDGGIDIVADGHRTIDFLEINKRFKSFGLYFDHKTLESLSRIRNEVEHFYTEKPKEALREAIATAFPVVVQLFLQIKEEPSTHLGETWDIMLETRELYEIELEECRKTFGKVGWISETIGNHGLICPSCESRLLRQDDPDNSDQMSTELYCRACGDKPDIEATIAKSLNDALAGEIYDRAKDTGEEGPIFHCNECFNDAYVDFEERCAACGYRYNHGDCVRCHASLTMDEIIHGNDNNLCSWCNHMLEKLMRE